MSKQTTYHDYKGHKIKVEVRKAEHSLRWDIQAPCEDVVNYTFAEYCKNQSKIDESVAYVVGKIEEVIDAVFRERVHNQTKVFKHGNPIRKTITKSTH